jgi:hypothetical protein
MAWAFRGLSIARVQDNFLFVNFGYRGWLLASAVYDQEEKTLGVWKAPIFIETLQHGNQQTSSELFSLVASESLCGLCRVEERRCQIRHALEGPPEDLRG